MKRLALCLAFVSFAGCSDSSNNNNTTDNNNTTGVSATAAITAACGYFERCAVSMGRVFTDTASCTQFLNSTVGCTAGTFNNTQAEVDACAAFLNGLACGPTFL